MFQRLEQHANGTSPPTLCSKTTVILTAFNKSVTLLTMHLIEMIGVT